MFDIPNTLQQSGGDLPEGFVWSYIFYLYAFDRLFMSTPQTHAWLTDYQRMTEALAYMHQRALAGPVIARLAEHPDQAFADQAAWTAHLDRLGVLTLKVNPDPVMVAELIGYGEGVAAGVATTSAVDADDGAGEPDGRAFAVLAGDVQRLGERPDVRDFAVGLAEGGHGVVVPGEDAGGEFCLGGDSGRVLLEFFGRCLAIDLEGYLRGFVERMMKMNRGRAFYTTPETLGDYVLVDFIEHKKQLARGRQARRAG